MAEQNIRYNSTRQFYETSLTTTTSLSQDYTILNHTLSCVTLHVNNCVFLPEEDWEGINAKYMLITTAKRDKICPNNIKAQIDTISSVCMVFMYVCRFTLHRNAFWV